MHVVTQQELKPVRPISARATLVANVALIGAIVGGFLALT